MDVANITHTEIVQFKKLHPDAIIPTRGTKHSIGYDLFALEDTTVVGGLGNVLVPTGIAVQLPPGTYGRIAMRSGLATKQHLGVSAGVIDIDYNGPLGVVVFISKIFDSGNPTRFHIGNFNHTDILDKQPPSEHVGHLATIDNPFAGPYSNYGAVVSIAPHTYVIRKGEKFAQLIIEYASYANSVEVLEFERIHTPHEGFGSTGDGLSSK